VVKCLVFFHPEDAHGLRWAGAENRRGVPACCQSGHELLLEVILPATMPRSTSSTCAHLPLLQPRHLPGLVEAAAALAEGWTALSEIIERRDPHCRGVVILGLDAPAEQLRADFKPQRGSAG
jgi:5-dehydro-2-deoxygluconokinase